MPMPYIPPVISVIIFSIWIVLFLLGRAQLNRIKDLLAKTALNEIDTALVGNKDLSINQYYELLYPKFEIIVKTNSRFIPHKTELFPMPSTPKYVKTRINFTPEWLGAYMQINGYLLKANRSQKKIIDQLLLLQKVRSQKYF
jgi:hypothetical protein